MDRERIAAAVALFFAAALVNGCESTGAASSAPPPVTAAMVKSGAAQHHDAAELTTGRSLYLARCAKCHALPNVAEHPASEWPGIVADMSKRSGLRPPQAQAVLAYVLAARGQ
jgi:cytochrome c5